MNFFAFLPGPGFFTAMNSPDVLLRLVQVVAPASYVLIWVRFFSAPLRALSPTGLFTAIGFSIRFKWFLNYFNACARVRFPGQTAGISRSAG